MNVISVFMFFQFNFVIIQLFEDTRTVLILFSVQGLAMMSAFILSLALQGIQYQNTKVFYGIYVTLIAGCSFILYGYSKEMGLWALVGVVYVQKLSMCSLLPLNEMVASLTTEGLPNQQAVNAYLS